MENPASAQHIDPYVISIVELDFHYDSLDGVIKIFESHVQKIHVFTTVKNIQMLSEISYGSNVVFHPYNSLSKFLFLFKNRKIFQASNLIFINTIALNFGAYLAIPGRDKTVLRIHNINKQFIPFKSVIYPRNLFTAWKFSSYVGREIILKLFPLFRAITNKRIRHFTFPDNGLKDYVLAQSFLKKEKIMESIPLKVFSSSEVCYFKDELVITIIGATDNTRRNYEDTIRALQEIYKYQTIKIKLVLLGKLKGQYGEWIFEELSKIQQKEFSFQYFRHNVAENEFVEALNQSHLVISPLVAETKTDIFREVYGKTKTSGSILDFIKFGIVTLIPDYYNPPREMEVFFQKYDAAEGLAQKILYFYENPEVLNQLNRESKEFVAANYNLDKIYKLCIHSLKPILDKNDH